MDELHQTFKSSQVKSNLLPYKLQFSFVTYNGNSLININWDNIRSRNIDLYSKRSEKPSRVYGPQNWYTCLIICIITKKWRTCHKAFADVLKTPLPPEPHTCICVSELGRRRFRKWLVAQPFSEPMSTYGQLDQTSLKFESKFNIFISENAFENVACEIAASLSRGRWVSLQETTMFKINHCLSFWLGFSWIQPPRLLSWSLLGQ